MSARIHATSTKIWLPIQLEGDGAPRGPVTETQSWGVPEVTLVLIASQNTAPITPRRSNRDNGPTKDHTLPCSVYGNLVVGPQVAPE